VALGIKFADNRFIPSPPSTCSEMEKQNISYIKTLAKAGYNIERGAVITPYACACTTMPYSLINNL
jgi:hypothetical protein